MTRETKSPVDAISSALRVADLDVHADDATRSMYSSDASLYRIRPLAVVRPRSTQDVATTLDVARANGVPVTARGAGTSVAGNAIGPGIILDFSRHMDRVLSIDPDRKVALVEPGTVQATLQRAAAPYGLRFGPDPSTHSRCTIGGMIGNNACGARSVAYGRTSDNVDGLVMLTASGVRLATGYDDSGRSYARGAESLVSDIERTMRSHLATARQEFGRFGRQLSGYSAEHLLPERFDLTKALVGSEGTLGIITQATVRLITDPAARIVVVLGFDSIVDAAVAAPAVVSHGPTACEGLDSRLVDVIRERRGARSVPDLPRGAAWLFVEFSGSSQADALAKAAALASAGIGVDSHIVADSAHQTRLWRIREDGAGTAGRSPSNKPAWPGWEDAAVPPTVLGAYLSDFEALVASYGMSMAPFGHFGEGCVHVRLDLPLHRDDATVVLRSFLTDAASLVGHYGGSLSGEHGDGRARSELLPHMYSADALRLFEDIKRVFDPAHILNPGVLVQPDPVDQAVRIPPVQTRKRTPLALAFSSDDGDLARAVHRCTGVGRCRADNLASGDVMCPSFQATREEKDSTRGRARILQDVVSGQLAWNSIEVEDALDLCLSCKGCASDCPTGIDMATYKSEALHQRYRRRLRPRSHYTLGWLPLWSRLAGLAPRTANIVTRLPILGRLLLRLVGVDPRRSVPAFAERSFRNQYTPTTASGNPVILWVDSFSNSFDPEVAAAAIRVLEHAGYSPTITERQACCGLTWITTGQLDLAKRILRRTISQLAPAAREGIPIVGLEPSCLSVLRHDAVELLPTEDSRLVASKVQTLAELLSETPGWSMPDLSGVSLLVQPHCHHHAVLGWATDAALLEQSRATVHQLSGCCGLAGNFGVEIGHYEVSIAVANQQLLPSLDDTAEAIVLADGFSCRTQVMDLRGRHSVHLAQLLDAHATKNPAN